MINVHALRERRACMLAKLDRPTFQYEKMAGDDDALREELKVLAGKRRRFDYRRLGTLLEREGFYENHKKAFRIYTEEGPSVKRRLGRNHSVADTVLRHSFSVPAPTNYASLKFSHRLLNNALRMRFASQ